LLRTFSDFVAYCRSLKGKVLLTGAYAKEFSVDVDGNQLYFVPLSSGKRRRADCKKTERVLTLLAGSMDWSPGSYQLISHHASYILAVARRQLNEHAEALPGS
jgi:hypothetical protein